MNFLKNEKSLVSILYASSSSIYGENLQEQNTPISVYAVSKKTLEEISKVYCEIYKMKFVGMRFFLQFMDLTEDPICRCINFLIEYSQTKKYMFIIMEIITDLLHILQI